MKKRMDFGHGSQNEFIWLYTNDHLENQKAPSLMESLKNFDVKLNKLVTKWERTFLLDSNYFHYSITFIEKGRVFQWEINKSLLSSNKKEELKKEQELIKEIDSEVEGKAISQHKIKDIAATSNCLFMTTENGEVLIGKAQKGDEESASEYSHSPESDDLFVKRLSKINAGSKLQF